MAPRKAHPPDELILAVRQFNDDAWFACHETLEDLWFTSAGEARDLYQGILQIAVALHHWKNGNFAGAMKLIRSGLEHLDNLPPICQQVAVADFVASIRDLQAALQRLGRERIAELEPSLIPRLRWAAEPS
ncbi:MAG: DUF309 domain-containing protein [Deltaproteobacteria bacterium]|nr:DUF309 domain-containing protein [Deltaproteobacteria bacterium]